MVSDSTTPNAAIPSGPKDFGKKKRANRSARLKQCKLDARREQWLSQGTGKSKEGKVSPRASPPPVSPCKNKGRKKNNLLEKLETGRRVVGEEENENENENGNIENHHHHHHHHEFDIDSPSSSPISNASVLGVTDTGTNFTASSSCSGSSSGGSCSGNVSEDEEDEGEGEEDDNCLDDWEAVADALAAENEDAKEEKTPDDDPNSVSGSSHHEHEPPIQSPSLGSTLNLRPECLRAAPPRMAPCNTRAWRPDDAFRPQTLPTLAKQRSFPHTNRSYVQGGLPWCKSLNQPSSCPICCEDLDPTDSSFSPCTCGFRLCLFCHKRILEEDGRCPSCRKPYQQQHNKVEAEASLHGGSLTLRLARSCSMRS